MSLEQVVQQYIESRQVPHISTASALRAIRTVLPDCPLDDRQLTELVARHAMRSGLAVSFDGEKETFPAVENAVN
jgi:hypothetical protein